MNVIFYVRVSTRDREQTVENQLIVLRRWADDEGHSVLATYSDEASSTRWDERLGWMEAMRRIEAGSVDCLAVTRLDRAYRSVRDIYESLRWLEAHGCRFLAVQQPEVNTATPIGNLLLALLGAVAQFELDLTRARSADGVARALAEGKTIGRPKGAKDKGTRRTVGYRHNQNAKRRSKRKALMRQRWSGPNPPNNPLTNDK